MNTAEVVIRKIQGDSDFQVLQHARESVGKPGQTPKLHSHGQVLPFNEAGRDMLRAGVSATNLGYNLRDSWWGVPLIPVLAIVPVELRQLSKVSVSRERLLDSLALDIGVCGQLHPVIGNATAHVQHEVLSVLTGSFAHQKRRNELSVRVKGHENPLIPKLCGIVLPNVPNLLRDKRPDFVALNTTAGQLAHSLIQKPFTALASQDQQSHDRVAVDAGKPLCAANRAALDQIIRKNSGHSFAPQ